MKTEEIYDLKDEHLQLRKKEVLEGLSSEEKRKLERIMGDLDVALSKKHSVSTEASQMYMSVKVVAVRNYKFEEQPVKQSFFEKLKKKEQIFYYELIVANEEDIQSDYYDFSFALSLIDLMKENGLGNQWNQILPPAIDTSMFHEFILNKKEMDWIKELPDPAWCLQMVSEIKDLEGKALRQSGEDMHDAVTWLKHRWSEGYQIYIDYSELGWLDIR